MSMEIKTAHIALVEHTKAQLETELRFDIASAKADGVELIELEVSLTHDDEVDKRILNFITRILGVMRREGLIQFYATPRGFADGAKEAEFLKNKYPEHLHAPTNDAYCVYVRCP